MPSGIYQHKKGYKRPPLSEETRRRMSLSRQGEKHPMWGKKHRPESIYAGKNN